MIFDEFSYLVILSVSLLLYLIAPLRWRKFVLMIAGIAFYSYYAGYFVLLLLAETIVAFLLASNSRSRIALILGALMTVGILGYFKYKTMVLSTLAVLSQNYQAVGAIQKIAIPLAISFFTFEFLHYIIDCHSGKIKEISLWRFLAFIFFFPSLVAGPIKRYQQFEPTLQNGFSWGNVYYGVTRIVTGLFKKIVLADTFALFITPLTNAFQAETFAVPVIWGAVFSYSVYIYLDFSGYSDIAIGSARLFGITVPENFNWPYLSKNVSEFWKRWHMSLYSWIMDYVFKPFCQLLERIRNRGITTLNGDRSGAVTVIGIIVTWSLSGLWHGANWNFVLWGLYHGILVSGHKAYSAYVAPVFSGSGWYRTRIFTAASTLLTFVLVSLGWVLFAGDINTSFVVFRRLLGVGV